MKLEYENGVLLVENSKGVSWKQVNVDQPEFSFDYEALNVNAERAVRRTGTSVHPLTESEIKQIVAYIEQLQPPESAFQQQVINELRMFAHGLINSVVTQLDYNGLLDVMITGREGSGDLYAEEARNIMCYIDSVWNAFYGLEAQVRNTPKAELKSVKEYAELMPFPPDIEYFSGNLPQELFNGARDKS